MTAIGEAQKMQDQKQQQQDLKNAETGETKPLRRPTMRGTFVRYIALTFFVVACVACGGSSSTQPSSASSAAAGTYMICYTQSNAHGVTRQLSFPCAPR